jgi:hypothetical protein
VIVNLGQTSADVEDADDLSHLEVRLSSAGQFCSLPGASVIDGDDGHMWLEVAALRDWAGAGKDATWHARFTDMITYAEGQGWVDPAGTAVRAHIASDPETAA